MLLSDSEEAGVIVRVPGVLSGTVIVAANPMSPAIPSAAARSLNATQALGLGTPAAALTSDVKTGHCGGVDGSADEASDTDVAAGSMITCSDVSTT
jgi:hypothetical protein